ncbi:hypothetical protein ACU6U9_02465 [Pseudomonas sp. HK3]
MASELTQFGVVVRNTIVTALEAGGFPLQENAITLLLMIAAHESQGFRYCRQLNGPALGLWQMEPATYNDAIEYLKRTGKFTDIPRVLDAEELVVSPTFAAAMARVQLWRDPEPLPDADDLMGLAKYAKRVWNTELGKATVNEYLNDYLNHVEGVENEIN